MRRPDLSTQSDGVAGSGRTALSDGGDPTPHPEPAGPAPGEGDPIQVRDVEDDEHVTYVPEEGTVRYVGAWRSKRPDDRTDGAPPEREPVYETTPYERWARIQALSAAGSAAAEHVRGELDAEGISGSVTSTIEGRDSTPIVSTSTVLDRAGNVRWTPTVSFEALVAATPATASVTYVLADREFDLETPVYAEHTVVREQ